MEKAGASGGVAKKQQHPLIEVLLNYDFDDAFDKTTVS